MHTTRRARRVLATVLTGAVIVAGSLLGGSAASATVTTAPKPIVMAALGDSITQALMTCSSLSGCPVNSWSTGSTASVKSHATLLNVPAAGRLNDSVSGAKSDALVGQAGKAVTQGAKYVTIEIGANDACTKNVAAMTPVGDLANPVAGTFAFNIKSALTALSATTGPQPEIFVASIPNLKTLWSINYKSASARFTWAILGICQSMLVNPSSTSSTDNNRRDQVQAQVTAYNLVLEKACAATSKCRFDNNAVANTAFLATDISTRDYFHPSLAGQTKLASVTWAETQWVK